MRIRQIAISGLIAISGCTSIPEERAEQVDNAITLPETYDAHNFPALDIVDSLLELFDDPALDKLIAQALQNNPDLLRTQAEMREAGYIFEKTRGQLFPSLSGGGSATRTGAERSSTNTNYSAGLDARWEVDIWGKLSDQTRASAADLAQAEANYDASRQSLAAQTMQGWFELIAATQLHELSKRQLHSFESTYKLVERRYENGTATIVDLELTHTDAANARGDYHTSKDNRDQVARALQTLLGNYPDTTLDSGLAWPELKRTVPADLPSDLLLARPDIIAAYQNILATDARAQAAYADLFPSFTLTASGGRSSDTLSDLGRSSYDAWSLAGGVVGPIFEGGQRRAEVRASEQRAEQAYQRYRSIAINAFREVEDALNSESYLADEEAARTEALKAARTAEAKSLREYESGLLDLLDLLAAQRRVFNNEIRSITLHKERLNNRVSLALALGKGI